jgi:FAD synthase
MTKKNKKHILTQNIMKYVSNGNEFNISEFRKDNASDYAKIAYYFGSINNMLKELKLIKINSSSTNKMTLRDSLAYDLLVILKNHYTLEEIAEKYGVTKALVNQLSQSLEISVRTTEVKKLLNNSDIK